MVCPLCQIRKARRSCPALGREICPVCCGTKRRIEIRCPSDCSWLVASRAHPPATVLRQRDRDLQVLVPMLRDLPERPYLILVLLQDLARRYRPTTLPPLQDSDVEEAAASLAATYEVAARGLIYEHQASSLPAQRLLGEWQQALERQLLKGGRSESLSRDVALALRRIEWAAREARRHLDPSRTSYLDLLNRLQESAGGDDPGKGSTQEAPRIIVP
jgi:hypothetical protein